MTDHQFYARTFALLALLAVAYLLYLVLAPFFAPIAWAFFIAFLLHPTHAWIVKRSARPTASAGLLTAATLVILVGPLAGLGASFAAQVAELLRYAQQYAATHKPPSAAELDSVPLVGSVLAWLDENVGVSLAQVQAWAVEAARTVLGSLASLGQRAFLGALGTVVGFLLMLFILFFAIRDGRAMFAALRELVPLAPEDKARLFGHLASVLRAMVYGTGVTALVQGALISIGFAIVHLPSPVVFGVLAALLALVPMAGTPVVWVPAVIALVLQGRYYAAIFLLAWGGFVVTIDNFLRPWLVSGRAQVGTLTVFIGVLGGVGAFGPIGIFLGPLVLALAVALVDFALEGRTLDQGKAD
ncbi:MAG TPA: AI-2E family transporter [Burkholderiales bacterium]|nr:AI-2E family transporter [Burkholderiales bacterium]